MRGTYGVGALLSVTVWLAGAATASAFDPLPMSLPPQDARAAQASVTPTWLLGIRPTAVAHRIAARAGARRVMQGVVVIGTGQARAAAAALDDAGVLVYAEPDVPRRSSSALDGSPDQWARGAVVPPAMAVPPVGAVKIGLVDSGVDVAHPDIAGHATTVDGGRPMTGPHGTMVASVAAGSAGNGGVMGVLPGAPLVSYSTTLTCSDVARGIAALTDAGVGVINLSLGSPETCVSEYVAVMQAIGEDIVVVAAAGNEYAEGNPVEYPAALPHVLSVASVGFPDYASSGFSNANSAIDISAPGEGVPAAVPLAFDVDDGVGDGVTLSDGTSFSAPMVAGAAAWIRTVRPSLTGLQVGDTLRAGAVDLATPGWDADTGWGLLSIPGAVTAADPAVDPLEPNDDMPLVDGTYFEDADPLVYTGAAAGTVRATVDFAEDPYDVYRIRMPARSALKLTLRPHHGDPDLLVFHGGARHLGQRRAIVARSERSRGTDRVELVNSGRRARPGYVVVRAAAAEGTIDSRYTLRLARTRYRR